MIHYTAQKSEELEVDVCACVDTDPVLFTMCRMGDEVCNFGTVKVFSDCAAHVMDQIDQVNLRKKVFNKSKSSDFDTTAHFLVLDELRFQTYNFLFFTKTSEAQR